MQLKNFRLVGYSFILTLWCVHLSQAQTQLGSDIDGEATGDELGSSVSLDGNRVAIGAPYNDGTGSNAGHVRVYEWNALPGCNWERISMAKGLGIDLAIPFRSMVTASPLELI